MKVGILGNGQLAQLLTQAAYSLAIQTCPIPETHLEAILSQVKLCDVLTLENENIEVDLLSALEKHLPVYPGLAAVRVAQDRLLEKTCLQALGIPTTSFMAVNSLPELESALSQIGCPALLKTRRLGYDGKGQVLIKAVKEAASAWEAIGQVPAILEGLVAFDAEVSLIAARNVSGEKIVYPLIKNTHEAGILRCSESPYSNLNLQVLAEDYMGRLLTHFNYVGVLVLEFFVEGNTLMVNEMAPRVHNSGHLTIEGFNVSQFESHLRAVCNLPLIQPVLQQATTMHNIIGTFPLLTAEDYKNQHVYDYGKTQRPGRKLGHITQWHAIE